MADQSKTLHVLTEDDLTSLDKIEEKLVHMRKREAANNQGSLLTKDFTEVIDGLERLRAFLRARLRG